MFAPKVNTDTTGWRYKKSIPYCRPHVQFFFCLSPCPYIKNRDSFTATCTVTLISQNHENYVMYSHFNQFLVYKCAIHFASTKCQYRHGADWFLFTGPNATEVGELEIMRWHYPADWLPLDGCRMLLHLSVQPRTSFEVESGQLLRNVGNNISTTRPWCRTIATGVVVWAVRARGVMWEVHCAKPEQYV